MTLIPMLPITKKLGKCFRRPVYVTLPLSFAAVLGSIWIFKSTTFYSVNLNSITSESVERKEWMEEQVRRKQTLRYFCSTLQKEKSEDAPTTIGEMTRNRKLLSHILVSDAHQTLFCYIPKIACTQWKKLFILLSNQTSFLTLSDISNKQTHYGHLFTTLASPQFKDSDLFHKIKTYKKFVMVRNPLARLLSAFRDKFLEPSMDSKAFRKRYGAKMTSELGGRRPPTKDQKGDDGPQVQHFSPRLTFATFLNYLRERDPKAFQEHWRPFYHVCHPCVLDYDFVGKYETFAADSKFFLSLMGVGGLQSLRGFSDQKDSDTEFLLRHYAKRVDLEILDSIGMLFRHDFAAFHYNWTHFLHP